MVQIREENLISIFEESFKDEVQRIYDESSLTSFVGRKYSMEYNFLEGHISLYKWPKRIGTIFLHSGSDIFFEIDPSTCFGYYVGLFKHELEKFINSNQKRSRRKFLMR